MPKYQHTKANVAKLAMTLHAWHNSQRVGNRPWLTQKEIAKIADIRTKESDELALSTVNRLMEPIFGKKPMDAYRNLAEADDGRRKLLSVLQDAIDRYGKFYLGDDDE